MGRPFDNLHTIRKYRAVEPYGWLGRISRIVGLLVLAFSAARADAQQMMLTHLRGPIYVAEDPYYGKENSVVFVGTQSVTVVGATWTPETAELLADEIHKVTTKPISEVINTNYHPDRAGGNEYWKRAGVRIVSTQMTYDLLKSDWTRIVDWTRSVIPSFPPLTLTLPSATHPGDSELQGGRVQAFYLGASHTPDGLFVYFPQEKILYGGCILKESLGNLAFADLQEYPKTLRKLKQTHPDIDTIIAGHGTAVHGPDLIDRYLDLLQKNSPVSH